MKRANSTETQKVRLSEFTRFEFCQYVFVWFMSSAAASGWAGWALAHPEFGSSVNPITTKGVDYAHHITASPPGFENPAAALTLDFKYSLL